MGGPLPRIEFELDKCLDSCPLKIHARLNQDLPVMGPLLHMGIELPPDNVDALDPVGVEIIPDSRLLVPVFHVSKNHKRGVS